MSKKKNNKLKKIIFIIFLLLILLLLKGKIVYFFNNTLDVVNKLNFKIVSSKKLVFDKIIGYKDKIENIKNFNAQKENILKLKEKINLLEVKNIEEENLKKENEELRKMLKLPEKKYIEYLVAEIILIEDLKKDGVIYINKGLKDGIETNMPVISDGRLIGKINRVDEDYSEIYLLYNSEFKISVTVNGKVNSILRGEGNSKIIIKNFNLEDAENIKRFSIKTSGYSEYFPKDLLIGTYYINDNEKLLKERELELKSNINLSNISTVVIYKYDKSKVNLINHIIEKEGQK